MRECVDGEEQRKERKKGIKERADKKGLKSDKIIVLKSLET